jgi:aspartyl-tRNA synthetase|tara:strand:- start:4584 stop:5921 length:1338 start_codon:yes stop_codon:yes gene_type:complete
LRELRLIGRLLIMNPFLRSHYCKEILSEKIGSIVTIAGWIEDIRPMGSLVFMIIRDKTGVSQVVFNKKNTSSEIFVLVKNVPRQSIVLIKGILKEGKGKDIPIEVQAEEMQVLGEAIHPLVLDPTGRVNASIDTRLNARALDLRNVKTMSIFKIKHITLQSIRRTLSDEGYLEVNTAKIIGQAAEGGANLFPFDYFDKDAFLAQSPQLFKEQLTMSLDRVFEIGSYYRAEKSHTRRHLNEFISVDIEAAFAEKDDVMETAEKMVENAAIEVVEKCSDEIKTLGHNIEVPKRPFQRITYAQAIKELNRKGTKIKKGDDLKDHDLKVLGRIYPKYFWITDWPANLKPFYIARTPDGKKALSFDLQHGHLELASGGRRVSDGKELEERIQESGLFPKSFEDHLKTFRWGMPPHSGWGFGLDRFIMILTGMKNIREVVLYPRDQDRLVP